MSVITSGHDRASRGAIELETDLVQLALRAAQHQPILMAVYAGPPEWLEAAGRERGRVEELAQEVRDLAGRAREAGHDYVAGQANSVALQLDAVAGRRIPYDRMVTELLGVALEVPAEDEVGALRDEVQQLAARLEPHGGAGAVQQWESRRLMTGEPKWDSAMATYVAGRRYAFGGKFPLEIEESLEIVRISDELWSVNLNWYPPSRLCFQVNTATARTSDTTAYEVAHNIYPGDYLHLACLQQHAYRRRGHVAASIKLKNAPESVISEGIEETAYLRLFPDPNPDQLLACKLEWLRRFATLKAALAVQLDGRPDDEVAGTLANDGFMDAARVAFQLRLIKHPLWGPYQYTYILGRRLVEEADRRTARAGPAASAAYLDYLYTGLHTPGTFLSGLDAALGG